MTDKAPEIIFEHEDFDFETLEGEIKVDEQCRNLLHQFYIWMQNNDLTPERASELTYCVDYYLRDYLLDFLRDNPLRPKSGQLRYFAANWYITRTLEPEVSVLEKHLEGLVLVYTFFQELGLISADILARILHEAGERDYYQKRIEAFLALAGEGYEAWDKECPFSTVERGVV